MTRLGDESFQVAVSVNGTVGAGFGAETAGEGVRGDGKVDFGGKIVFEVSGPGAAARAAQLATAPHGNLADLLRETPPSELRVIESAGSFAEKLEGEVYGGAGELGVDEVFERLPPEIPQGLKEVYGPTAGLNLAADSCAHTPSKRSSMKIHHPVLCRTRRHELHWCHLDP